MNRNKFTPDTDSFPIRINTHASFSMSNNRKHFDDPIKPTITSTVKGAGGALPFEGIGAVQWKIKDDTGKMHVFNIPGTLYIYQK